MSARNPSADETDTPAQEVTVVNGDVWVTRPEQLAQLLSSGRRDPVIADPERRPPQPERMMGVTGADYWARDPRALGQALADLAATTLTGEAIGDPGAVGAVPPQTERLTLTVEEAAATLGISRAFAYEAVRRGELPSIRIGRRVLVPRSALERLLDAGGAPPRADSSCGPASA